MAYGRTTITENSSSASRIDTDHTVVVGHPIASLRKIYRGILNHLDRIVKSRIVCDPGYIVRIGTSGLPGSGAEAKQDDQSDQGHHRVLDQDAAGEPRLELLVGQAGEYIESQE